MKKLSILLIGLLLVAGFAFGDDEFDGTPSTDVDITASMTWGVDLNEGTTGFYNTASADVELFWLQDEDFETDEEDEMYGYIFIDDVELEFDGGAMSFAYDYIEAVVFITPLEVKIYAAPSFDVDAAPAFGAESDVAFINTDDVVIDNTTATLSNEADVSAELNAITGASIYGVTITVPVDPITVALKVASDGDWTPQTGDDVSDGDSDADFNSENNYAVGAGIDVDVDPIELGLDLTYGWFSGDSDFLVSATVDVELPVLMGLDFGVGFDGGIGIDPEVDFAWDADASLALAFTEENDDGDAAELSFTAYFAPYAAPADDFDVDAKVAFTEPEAGGFVDMLYADLAVELHDLVGSDGNELNWVISASGGYDTGAIDPYFAVSLRSDEVYALGLGVHLKSDLHGIDNTTFTLDYQADDLTDADPAETNDIGIITFKTAISF